MRVPGHQKRSQVWRWASALGVLAVVALAVVTWRVGDTVPTAEAQVSDTVDIIDGRVDVDQGGAVNTADDLNDVILIVNEGGGSATLKVVDIRDGRVDVNESGGITTDGADDVTDATLFDSSTLAGVQVDIDDGEIDVNGGGVDATDDMTGLRLVGDAAVTDKVDVIAGNVDVNESGSVTTADDRADVLVYVDSAGAGALYVVDVVDGGVDVNGSGDVTATDDLPDVTLFVSGTPGTGDQVDIVDGQVDVNESGTIDATDALTDALLVADFGGTDQVDIMLTGVDVNESGDITSTDDLADVLLEVDDDGARTLILVDIIDGGVDVNGDGNITPSDDVDEATAIVGTTGSQFNIVDGFSNLGVSNAILVSPAAGGVPPTNTPTNTPTITLTPTITQTPTITSTPTATNTPTPTGPTATPTLGPLESVTLVGGTCNPVASTYPDNTSIDVIDDAVSPAGILISIWWFDTGAVNWRGYSPQFPQVSDLNDVDRLEAIFICVASAGSWSRPEV